MVRRRDIGDDERSLWEEVTRDVRRPSRPRRSPAPSSEHKRAARVKVSDPAPVKPTPPAQPLHGKVRRDSIGISGVDGSTAERLRRGRIEPDATLDLHGMTQQQAHARLISFVRRGHDNGYRCLLVITGKGLDTRPETASGVRGFVMPQRSKAGVLRTLVPFWLEQAETRPLVVGIQAAHQRHGGSGALYVYLKRKRARV